MARTEVWRNECGEVCGQDSRGYRFVSVQSCVCRTGRRVNESATSRCTTLFHRALRAETVCRQYLDQHNVAVVCSARSGSTKALGTTNLLLKAASEALRRPKGSQTPGSITGTTTPNYFSRYIAKGGSPDASPRPSDKSPRLDSAFGLFGMTSLNGGDQAQSFNATVDLILSEHLNAARSTVRDPEILKELEAEIERDCDQLRSFLFAAQVPTLPSIPLTGAERNYRSSTKFLQDQETVSLGTASG